MFKVLKNGELISQSCVLKPGLWMLPAGIHLEGDDIILDGQGATLVGNGQQAGLTITNGRRVTVRNLTLHNFTHGIIADQCQQLTIERCTIRTTAELPPNGVFLDIWRPADNPYGAAILLRHVRHSRISSNDLQHQMNGLLTYHCHHLEVDHNQANYNSGFGFHLYDTHHSDFHHNSADFCSRYHARGANQGHMGADAAGF